jgi:hypothetical protein
VKWNKGIVGSGSTREGSVRINVRAEMARKGHGLP